MKKKMLPAIVVAILVCAAVIVLAQRSVAQPGGTAATTTLAAPATALSESTIKSDITAAGYREVQGLAFKDGVWQARARNGNDKWTSIEVAPTTGKVYEADVPSHLDANEIKARLTAQGYQDIGHVKFDKGLWSAKAQTAHGAKVKLLVGPDDGNVVATERG